MPAGYIPSSPAFTTPFSSYQLPPTPGSLRAVESSL
jgi:hypothetical protein